MNEPFRAMVARVGALLSRLFTPGFWGRLAGGRDGWTGCPTIRDGLRHRIGRDVAGTAIVAGGLISALGGSRMQIGGPTGAFVVHCYEIRHVWLGVSDLDGWGNPRSDGLKGSLSKVNTSRLARICIRRESTFQSFEQSPEAVIAVPPPIFAGELCGKKCTEANAIPLGPGDMPLRKPCRRRCPQAKKAPPNGALELWGT